MSVLNDPPIRVLLMISSMRGGGSEQQTLLLLRHLDRTRFTPHLYLLERAGNLLPHVPDDVIVHSFQDAPTRRGMNFPGRELRRQIRHVRSVLTNEAIEVIYDRTFHMTMIAGPAAKPLGVPRISTIVSPPEYALPLVETRFVTLKRRRLATAYRSARRVVAVSRQAADSAQRYYGLLENSIEVVPNPVDVMALRESVGHAELASTKPDEIHLVCVGRMTVEKGHRDLIDAMIRLESVAADELPAIRLSLIGDGPLRVDLESDWNQQPRRHTIEFVGRQDNAAKSIAQADALVLPSHFEGMPNVVLEAMALGTPVIATRAGGTIELEHDEPTILWAESKSPNSIADAISNFAANRNSACERAEAATRMITKFHDIASTTRRIEKLLSESRQATKA